MVPYSKLIAVQAWGPEFETLNWQWKERRDPQKVFTDFCMSEIPDICAYSHTLYTDIHNNIENILKVKSKQAGLCTPCL